jgi:hypothetical protein
MSAATVEDQSDKDLLRSARQTDVIEVRWRELGGADFAYELLLVAWSLDLATDNAEGFVKTLYVVESRFLVYLVVGAKASHFARRRRRTLRMARS